MSETILPQQNLNDSFFYRLSRVMNDLFKRAVDLLAAAFGLLLLSPFFAIIAWRIKRDSPGPVFYHGARIGRSGKVFHILKFRTMHERDESYKGPRITAQDDERVTTFGKFLRDTKLNELPQLWNVLKGEMSLVGPRPEDPEVAVSWPIEVLQDVLSMRPGVTSPASVLYRDEENMLAGSRIMDTYLGEILPSKLRLDQIYVRHHTFWGDLDIIFWTLLVLLPRIGKFAPPEESLFLGPLSRLMSRHVSWFLADVLVTFIAMGAAGLFFRAISPLNVGWLPAFVLALGFAMLYSMANYFLGVNRIVWSKAPATDAIDLVPGALISTIIALLVNNFWPAGLLGLPFTGVITPWGADALLPTSMLLMSAGLAFTGFVLVRYRSRLITGLATRWLALRGNATATLERVLIVGGGETGQFAAWMLKNNQKYFETLQIVGFADDDLFIQGVRIHGFNVLGRRVDIPQLVARHDIGILIFAIHNISASERQQVLDICTSTPAHVVLFPDIPSALNGIVQSSAKRNGHKSNGKSSNGDEITTGPADPRFKQLPCDLCLTKVSPLKVDGWLAKLEEAASSGDHDSLMSQLQGLRNELRGSVAEQYAANKVPRNGSLPIGDTDGDSVHPHPNPLPVGEGKMEEG